MKLFNFLFLIILISLFTCCKKEVKPIFNKDKIAEKESFEKKVFQQVFLEVVDSTYRDGRLYIQEFPSGTDLETRKEVIEKDTSKLVFAVDTEKYKINLTNFETEKFLFRDISEFPKDDKYKIWETKYDFGFAGAFYFSKIDFDNKKEYGKLKVSFACGTRCGWHYQVFIKRINNKWIIDKVDLIAMS